jgi:hypothetical protein
MEKLLSNEGELRSKVLKTRYEELLKDSNFSNLRSIFESPNFHNINYSDTFKNKCKYTYNIKINSTSILDTQSLPARIG